MSDPQRPDGDRPPPIRLVVMPARAGVRLDQYLAAATELSRRKARALIADGLVARNQNVLRVASRPVEAGDVVDLLLPPAELVAPELPQLAPERMLFDDRWLLVADKPQGVLSQPAEDRREHSFDQIVLLHLALRDGRRPFLRMVHRLDRPTSGCVLFARNPQALTPLTEAWSSGRVQRSYLAVVGGRPDRDRFTVEETIGRDPDHRWRFRVDEGGKPARTHVEVLSRSDDGWALLRCRLDTGRTHQVRVHLAHLGHPVLGDRLYGAPTTAGVERPLLHAHTLALPHPKERKHVEVEAPVPEDMQSFVG